MKLLDPRSGHADRTALLALVAAALVIGCTTDSTDSFGPSGSPTAAPSGPTLIPTVTGEGPASAILDAGDVEPAEVVGYYVPALEFLGYHTLSRSEPREDGSIEVEWAGETSCRIRLTATPLGSTTVVTVLYGAECPFE